MSALNDLFQILKCILEKYAEVLDVVKDEPENFYLNTGTLDEKGKPIFFGMVKLGKGKITYHLMPIYCHPDLLDGISDALKAHMQGKSCFNFSSEDSVLLEELAVLTENGYRRFKDEGKI